MTEKKVSEQLAELSCFLRYDDLPQHAQYHAKTLVLDLLGSMIGSKRLVSSKIATELALELGGPEESTVIGYRRKVSAPNAAFANAIQSYAFDYADDHNESNAHPSPATIPASLALGERFHATGKQLLEAVVLGNETVCRLGAAFLGKTYYQGFHPTSTCGMFGATISAGKLLKLNPQQIVWSLGIAGSMTSGLMAWNTEGSFTKRGSRRLYAGLLLQPPVRHQLDHQRPGYHLALCHLEHQVLSVLPLFRRPPGRVP
jgi:2-methylcitrate dehydratase PrpD